MTREFPAVTFERYVDDAVVHCKSETQARAVVAAIAERMEQVGLRLHPGKTRIVYCKDGRGAARTNTPPSPSWGSRSSSAGRGARAGDSSAQFCPR